MAVPVEFLEADRKLIWGLCYRMTGNAADAEDLVQETFVRALEHPPRVQDDSVRPWLIRVAINLSRDLLRHRRRRTYAGEWLPAPVPTDESDNIASYEPPALSKDSPAARYDLIESISFAFLIALEALTPVQRAVLLLRDVFDYSTAETAEALGITEANVKVHLHRARRRMQDYENKRATPGPRLTEMTRIALEKFMHYLSAGDTDGLERLLTEDAISVSDGGGKVAAAIKPIYGRDKVIRLISGLYQKTGGYLQVSIQLLNGLPALVAEFPDAPPGVASMFTLHLEVDSAGQIRRVDTVAAPDKLYALNQRKD
jgi:RNA polymerase sigma-70 factor (ECF subfamily)